VISNILPENFVSLFSGKYVSWSFAEKRIALFFLVWPVLVIPRIGAEDPQGAVDRYKRSDTVAQ
jgi:hypothetical protein